MKHLNPDCPKCGGKVTGHEMSGTQVFQANDKYEAPSEFEYPFDLEVVAKRNEITINQLKAFIKN